MNTTIETNDLTKKFRDNVYGVNNVSFSVKKGEIFGFLGSNGAGKTTTINMLLDFVHPSSGSAEILGFDTQEDTKEVRRRVGILPEDFGLYPRLTGFDHIRFAKNSKNGDEEVDDVIDRIGLSAEDGSRAVSEYSRGMKQRLGLGMALVGKPEVLILDEPSTGLDPNGIKLMRDIAREETNRGVTVFFSSHILGQVEAVCDRVGILNQGELIAVDTIGGLRDSVGTGSVLILKVDREINLDVLRSIDGIDNVFYENDRVHFDISDRSAKVVAINKIEEQGAKIKDIISKESSLEDLFSRYTGSGEL